MTAFLVLLFVIVPLAELAVIIKVGSWLGVGETLGLLLLVSIVGAWLVKRQGVGALRRIQRQIDGNVLTLSEDDLRTLIRNTWAYGGGGFQDRTKPTAGRVIKKR